ncbi:hypothetical protein [Spirosoma sp. KNUC1025]|uniref:hypothetical protein n=1 Tax=Spirosoma sp. KNUC1025 TaxID=2894082 RepID=UPI001E5BB30D|nr:hypothetical protein [Spirosoma sp. KNUC1025]UFH57512.1 hypothetical protein LN737_30890 [Spirosoma sp. KNUC1025]
MLDDLNENNSFAYNTHYGERRVIHIDQAESGKKGYVCIGCGQEMIAYNQGKFDRRHYFGHDPKDVEHRGQCTFSNETYRHQVAKAILQRIKQIKVPAVFVTSQIEGEGRPLKIRDAEIIQADRVEIEYVFFENEEGEIKYCPSSEWYESPQRYFLIQPDVTFFNDEGKPILLIEIVVTHKINDEKRFKLKCLGLNTVSVNIPKALPEIIEQAFSSIQHTHWAYNYEQATTNYVPVSNQSSRSVSSIDELPHEFYEETYRCRATQIGGLVRAFEKCLASESYRTVEEFLREEESRVTANSERYRQRLQRLQATYEETIRAEFADSFRSIENEQTTINNELSGLGLRTFGLKRNLRQQAEQYEADLGRRYQSKKSELSEKGDRMARREEDYIQRWARFLEGVEGEVASLEKRIKEFGTRGWSGQKRREQLSQQTANIERQIADIEQQIANSEDETAAIESRRTTLSAIYKRTEDELEREFQKKKLASEQMLSSKKNDLKRSLSKLNNELEMITQNLENKQLIQLGTEMAEEHLDWPNELRNYLKQADSSSILKKKNAIADVCKQLENGLNRELGVTGLSQEQFLALMDRNIKKT